MRPLHTLGSKWDGGLSLISLVACDYLATARQCWQETIAKLLETTQRYRRNNWMWTPSFAAGGRDEGLPWARLNTTPEAESATPYRATQRSML